MHIRTAVVIAIASTAAASFSAQAQQSYDLRALTAAVGFAPGDNSNIATTQFRDFFNNGNPLAGGTYTGGITGSGSYTTLANGLPASAELNGPASDYFGTTFGVGRLRFNAADATPNPTNLDAAGTTGVSSRLFLTNPVANSSLLGRGQSFEVATGWNYATPDASSFYGIRLNDSRGGTSAYNDLIDFRVVRGSAGQGVVNLRRLSSDGFTLTATSIASVDVSSGLLAGHGIAEVAIIELNLHYNALGGTEPTIVRPAFFLLNSTGDEIGEFHFAQTPDIFNGENFTSLQVAANWTVAAVPEPGSAALLLSGAAGLAWRLRRRNG